MRILAVDDDPTFRRFLQLGLDTEGVDTDVADSGQAAVTTLKGQPAGYYDLILLDVEMPSGSGWDLLYDLREAGNETPVIFVTGREATDDKVKGLGLGADDYVIKPVDISELIARIQAVVRRRETLAPLEYGELRLDLARRRVRRGEKDLELSPREFDLLMTLVKAKGEIVSRQTLLSEVWDMDFDPGTNILDVHIGRLRKKVDRQGRPLIHNERGKGYRVVAHLPTE